MVGDEQSQDWRRDISVGLKDLAAPRGSDSAPRSPDSDPPSAGAQGQGDRAGAAGGPGQDRYSVALRNLEQISRQIHARAGASLLIPGQAFLSSGGGLGLMVARIGQRDHRRRREWRAGGRRQPGA